MNVGASLAFALTPVALGPLSFSPPEGPTIEERIELRFDFEEAETALDLASKTKGPTPIPSSDWEHFFALDACQRLARREKEIGRPLEPAAFQAFLASDELSRESATIRATLDAWKKADLQAAARRTLAYLPAEAFIHATVFAVVKPQKNSFVFEPKANPAIFLAVDPEMTREQFENTVAHELHHIGFASLPESHSPHPAEAERVLPWIGAFGEGFAMLAAAGGPDVHPHEHSSKETRERWDRDVAGFDSDLAKVQSFFLDVLDRKLLSDDDVRKAGMQFFGVQGPWYTVGWKMAVTVERRYGRAVLVDGMRDPPRLLATYNEAAKELDAKGGEKLATWSPEFLKRLGAEPLTRGGSSR
jgi:hypothetical protein